MSLVPHLTSFWGAIPLDPYLGLPTPSTVPFLSDAPVSEGQVSLLLGQASGVDIWMDRAKVVSFVPLARGDHVRRFYWRDAAGLVWERSEDWRRYDMGGRQPEMHREALYVHLQMEKRESTSRPSAFSSLARRPPLADPLAVPHPSPRQTGSSGSRPTRSARTRS